MSEYTEGFEAREGAEGSGFEAGQEAAGAGLNGAEASGLNDADAVAEAAQAPEASGSGEAEAEAGASSSEEEVAADPLAEAMDTISNLEAELARARADLYNLTQEYNGYVKRSKADGLARYDEGIAKVANTLLAVLDDAQLARDHEDLTGTAGRIVEKLEQTLETNFKIQRFGAEGDSFDPTIHEALMHSTSPEVSSDQVGTLIQPGYRMGEKLLRPARVGVVSPE